MPNALDELAAIQTEHWVEENLNLGQYRTKFVCICGAAWVHDGHDPEQVPGKVMFAHHIADMIIDAGYRKVVTRPVDIPVLPGQITVDAVLGA